MTWLRGAIALLTIGAAVLWPWVTDLAQAQGVAVPIEGRVVNGTPEGGSVDGIVVALFGGEAPAQPILETTTDAEGGSVSTTSRSTPRRPTGSPSRTRAPSSWPTST